MGDILLKIGKSKLAELYKYCYNQKNISTNYKKEKTMIKEFITKENFEGLRLFLLELEEQTSN